MQSHKCKQWIISVCIIKLFIAPTSRPNKLANSCWHVKLTMRCRTRITIWPFNRHVSEHKRLRFLCVNGELIGLECLEVMKIVDFRRERWYSVVARVTRCSAAEHTFFIPRVYNYLLLTILYHHATGFLLHRQRIEKRPMCLLASFQFSHMQQLYYNKICRAQQLR